MTSTNKWNKHIASIVSRKELKVSSISFSEVPRNIKFVLLPKSTHWHANLQLPSKNVLINLFTFSAKIKQNYSKRILTDFLFF